MPIMWRLGLSRLVFLVASVHVLVVLSGPDLDKICERLPNRRIIAHPDDCTRFVECFNHFPYVKKCSMGLHFNPDNVVCDYPEVANCQTGAALDNPGAPRRKPQDFPRGPSESLQPAQFYPRDTPRDNRRHPLVGRGPQRGYSLRDGFQETVYGMDRQQSPRRPAGLDMKSVANSLLGDARRGVKLRIRREIAMGRKMSNVVDSAPFRYVAKFLNAKPYAKVIAKAGMFNLKMMQMMSDKMHAPGEDVLKSLGGPAGPSRLFLRPMADTYEADHPMPVPPDIDYCPYPRMTCDPAPRYRTIDGGCNNPEKPLWGRSFTPFKRNLLPLYDDGIESMRKSVTGRPLPSARSVSLQLFPDVNRPDGTKTLTFVFWGQFVDHDLTLTAITEVPKDESMADTEEVKCGFDGCQTNEPGLEACWPIPVPEDDSDFRYNRCLKFVRSVEVPLLNCDMGAREQLNQVTHWLDASMIYGSTKEEADKIRDLSDPGRGGMAMRSHPSSNTFTDTFYKPILPPVDEPLCRDVNRTVRCFAAGDHRVNENSGLTIPHTLLVRQHNRIEAALHRINPQWGGERLYQESRRIISATIQHVTFNEWLPLVLGPTALRQYDLQLQQHGYYYGGDANIDPRSPNSFATAAFRFGHTLLQDQLGRASFDLKVDNSLQLSQTFFRPGAIYNTYKGQGGVDSLLRGLCEKNCQGFDTFFTKQITRSLFAERPPTGPGMDLVSLNIQRGRDHGLPGYNAFRQWCGFQGARTFDDLRKDIPNIRSRENLRKIYSHVDDIDLFAGASSEQSVTGGLVGPTFACIIGRRFRALRKADRFWYENDNDVRFTPEQLQEIRRITAARIFCINSDKVQVMQRWAFVTPSNNRWDGQPNRGRFLDVMPEVTRDKINPRMPCDEMEDIDLSKWRQGPYTGN